MTLSPVLVVGPGHSGTSVLTAMLDSHPRLWAVPGETRVFEKYPSNRLKRFAAWDQGGRWVEKTPQHLLVLDRVFYEYPNARVLACVRDPMDVFASRLARERKAGRANVWDFTRTRVLRSFEATRRAWDDERVMPVVYEHLIEFPERVLTAVCEHIEEPPAVEVMLRYHEKERAWYDAPRPHERKRNAQINRPLFDGRGKALKVLTEAEQARAAVELERAAAVYTTVACAMLKRYGLTPA